MGGETCVYRFGAWTLTLLEGEADTVEAWLVGPTGRRRIYSRAFDRTPLDLAGLGSAPRLCFDHAERPYVVWPCGPSALVWRCAQDAELWASRGMTWHQARSP